MVVEVRTKRALGSMSGEDTPDADRSNPPSGEAPTPASMRGRQRFVSRSTRPRPKVHAFSTLSAPRGVWWPRPGRWFHTLHGERGTFRNPDSTRYRESWVCHEGVRVSLLAPMTGSSQGWQGGPRSPSPERPSGRRRGQAKGRGPIAHMGDCRKSCGLEPFGVCHTAGDRPPKRRNPRNRVTGDKVRPRRGKSGPATGEEPPPTSDEAGGGSVWLSACACRRETLVDQTRRKRDAGSGPWITRRACASPRTRPCPVPNRPVASTLSLLLDHLDRGRQPVQVDPDDLSPHGLGPSRRRWLVDAGRALPLRAGQSPLQPHTGTMPGENANRREPGPPQGEPPAEHLERVWLDTGPTDNRQAAASRPYCRRPERSQPVPRRPAHQHVGNVRWRTRVERTAESAVTHPPPRPT